VVGVVGQLQLDVLISRLEAEYKVEAVLEPVAVRHRALAFRHAMPR
jgi:peptide subunit release factor RF-3